MLVFWRIKKGREADFEKYWKEGERKEGLIRERLSRHEAAPSEWDTWDEVLDKPDATAYINVGIWKDLDSFKKADPAKAQQLEFEAHPRVRVLLSPKWSRI